MPTAEPTLKNKPATSLSGRRGENLAANYLKKAGYRLVERNYRQKYGEIDIIATKGAETIFFEVKTRKSLRFGLPEEAVNFRKLRKIRRLAEYYASKQPLLPQKLRIKVIAIQIADNNLKSLKVIDVD